MKERTDFQAADDEEETDLTGLLSEPALADWNREEEDAAWAHLQQERPVTDAQRDEVLRRSEAHRRNPGEAIPLEEALASIERTLDDTPPLPPLPPSS